MAEPKDMDCAAFRALSDIPEPFSLETEESLKFHVEHCLDCAAWLKERELEDDWVVRLVKEYYKDERRRGGRPKVFGSVDDVAEYLLTEPGDTKKPN